MKKLLLILIVSLASLDFLQAQSLFTTMTYDEMVAKAKQEKKPFYVDLTATWCFPCKLMDETVFQDQMVINYTHSNYYAIQLDVEDFDALILKSEYKVTMLPTVLFFNNRGKLVEKIEGLQTGTHFLEILKKNG